MPLSGAAPHSVSLSAAAPSTPLGPFLDSAVAWTGWVTLMGFVGLTALAVLAVGPPARRVGAETLAAATARLSRAAVLLGVLAVPAVLAGSEDGDFSGLEVTLILVGAAAIAPLTLRRVAAGPLRTWLLTTGLGAGALALGATKFPKQTPKDWGRTSFETLMWMLHLIGGGVWIGGLVGLALLALPGAVAPADRGAFWAPAIRRFSATAMSCVAAITLSGLFLYWEHVDGPTQLVTTMYGRVLGVKILLFGALLLLGVFNQFWLHPRVDALRAAGDQRPLRTILVRQFPAVIGVEVLLALAVLFVAPFLHGSARNQAFQADAAKHSAVALSTLPKLAPKVADASTWLWGTAETVLVIAVMIAAYRLSARLAQRRIAATPAVTPSGPADLVEA